MERKNQTIPFPVKYFSIQLTSRDWLSVPLLQSDKRRLEICWWSHGSELHRSVRIVHRTARKWSERFSEGRSSVEGREENQWCHEWPRLASRTDERWSNEWWSCGIWSFWTELNNHQHSSEWGKCSPAWEQSVLCPSLTLSSIRDWDRWTGENIVWVSEVLTDEIVESVERDHWPAWSWHDQHSSPGLFPGVLWWWSRLTVDTRQYSDDPSKSRRWARRWSVHRSIDSRQPDLSRSRDRCARDDLYKESIESCSFRNRRSYLSPPARERSTRCCNEWFHSVRQYSLTRA